MIMSQAASMFLCHTIKQLSFLHRPLLSGALDCSSSAATRHCTIKTMIPFAFLTIPHIRLRYNYASYVVAYICRARVTSIHTGLLATLL